MTDKTVQALPELPVVAWFTNMQLDGKRVLTMGEAVTNPGYIKVHHQWKWEPLCRVSDAQAYAAQQVAAALASTSTKPADIGAVGMMDLDFARAMCRSAGISLVSRHFIERFADFVSDWKKGDFTLPKYAELDMQSCFDAWQAFDPEFATEPKQAKPSITLDFKQATELLEMFGGEPSELTLQIGDGHSGKGLYVHHTSYPEEGAEYLGVTDEEAVPCVAGDVTNLLGYKVLERTIYRLEKRQENSGRPDEEMNALKELFAALTPSSKQEGGQ